MIECSTFQKGRAKGGKESRVRVPMGTIYYIVTKVFSCQKMLMSISLSRSQNQDIDEINNVDVNFEKYEQ